MPRPSLQRFFPLVAVTLAAACGGPLTEPPAGDRAPAPVREISSSSITPQPSIPVFAGEGAPEPEMAIGLRYLYALSSGTISVYPRRSDGTIDTANPRLPPGTNIATIFQPLIAKLNASTHYPAATGIKDCTQTTATSLNLATATWSNVGCIDQPYDSDVYYDGTRDRFWIMTHLRPSIWTCDAGDPVNNFYSTVDSATKILTGAANPPCHAKSGMNVPRYIAVAVSKQGLTTDSEDPSNDWYSYVLVNEYGDWPQMMVSNDYLLLNTRDYAFRTNFNTYAFSADVLANNTHGLSGTVLQEPAWKYTAADFNTSAVDWMNNKDVNVNLTTNIHFVKQQDTIDNLTYMVGGAGSNIVVYALPTPTGTSRPPMVRPSLVNVGSRVPDNQVPAAWFNNQLYWAWSTCTNDDCTSNPKTFIRAYRIPVHHALHAWEGGNPMFASNLASDGFLEADVGVTDPGHQYALPIMNVNHNADILMEYHRYGFTLSPPEFPSVRYLMLYHDQTAWSGSVELAHGVTPPDPTKTIAEPWQGGVIDVASVVPDPLSPTQMFMSNAVATVDGNGNPFYRPIISAVDPGACAGNLAATQQFEPDMIGCGGSVGFANAPSLCGPGYRPCPSYRWANYVNSTPHSAPTGNYWTADALQWTGPANKMCSVNAYQEAGSNSCGANPMLVCTEQNNGKDGFGNSCTWTGCGLNTTQDEFFGGCSGGSAGTLCCAY